MLHGARGIDNILEEQFGVKEREADDGDGPESGNREVKGIPAKAFSSIATG